MLGHEDITTRYLVQRQGSWLGGGKNQILTFKADEIELCDATEREDCKEHLKLSSIVKIVPSRRNSGLT
jgi:hypothetical protein